MAWFEFLTENNLLKQTAMIYAYKNSLPIRVNLRLIFRALVS